MDSPGFWEAAPAFPGNPAGIKNPLQGNPEPLESQN